MQEELKVLLGRPYRDIFYLTHDAGQFLSAPFSYETFPVTVPPTLGLTEGTKAISFVLTQHKPLSKNSTVRIMK